MIELTPKEKKELAEGELAFAAQGKLVVNNEAYKQAMTAVRADLFDKFTRTTTDQPEIREEIWRSMVNLNKIEQYFNNILTTGKFAENALSMLESTNE